MIIITEEQIEFLKKHNVDISDALKNDEIELLHEIIDRTITENIVSNNDEPDREGIALQKVHDEIYYLQNGEDK